METVIQPRVRITYQGKDITSDISAYLLSVEYSDSTEDESDEASFTVENTEQVWNTNWRPKKKDKLQISIGYDSEMLDCGTFTVDEIEFSGPPDTVSIRALAASVANPIRTKDSKAYEKQTLQQIAEEIAKKHGYQIVNNMSDKDKLKDIKFERITQSRQTDLAFLSRISDDYGIMFSVRDTKLIFTSVYDIEGAGTALKLDRKDLMNYSVKDQAVDTYKSASVKHVVPKKSETVKFIYEGEGNKNAADTLEVRSKAEDTKQAETKAKAKLHKANKKEVTGSFSIEGNPRIVAGINFDLTGFGLLSGKWNVTKTTHRIDKSGGYTTDFDANFISSAPQTGQYASIGNVLFDTDKSVIRSEGATEIDRVVKFLQDNVNVTMEIAGHTDSNADANYNLALSERRANAVRDYMISKGIFATRLTAKGYGESQPVATNETGDGRQKNRRTDFVIVKNN